MRHTRLRTLGVAAMTADIVTINFFVDPSLPLEALNRPTILRSFDNTIFFCMLTMYLE